MIWAGQTRVRWPPDLYTARSSARHAGAWIMDHARQGASGGSLAWHRYLGTRAFTCTLRIRYLQHTRAHGVCVRTHARVRGLRLCVRAPATQPKAPHKRRCQRIGGREGRTGAQRLEAGVVGARGVGVEVDAGDWVEDAAARPSRDHRTRAPMVAGASGAWLLMSWCTCVGWRACVCLCVCGLCPGCAMRGTGRRTLSIDQRWQQGHSETQGGGEERAEAPRHEIVSTQRKSLEREANKLVTS